MKLHDLQPAEGSRKPRTRVGRGIAAGKGKTAGRGTKGQKARAGGGIPAWFEGGQTPLHMRIPKLRGFKNRFKIEYEVVNIGAIGALAEAGAFELEGDAKKAIEVGPDHRQPGHPARGRARPDAQQADEDPRRRRDLDPAVRGGRCVHRVGPGQDRSRRRLGQRPRGPEDAARGAGRDPRGRGRGRGRASPRRRREGRQGRRREAGQGPEGGQAQGRGRAAAAGRAEPTPRPTTEAADAAATPADTADADADEPTAADEAEPASGDDA